MAKLGWVGMCILALLCLGWGGASAQAATAETKLTPLAKVLKSDGTVDTLTGFAGALDVSGYTFKQGPSGEPCFVPSSSAGARSPDDDTYWGSEFSLPGADGIVRALAFDGAGNLYAGGEFTVIGDCAANYIAKWDGHHWSALGIGTDDYVYALAFIGGDVYVGGAFSAVDGKSANHIAKWNGSSWSALGGGANAAVYALAVDGTTLYAGGMFTAANGVAANYVAQWDGASWSALGQGTNDGVRALAVVGSTLYAGGYFSKADGLTLNCIAKWDGSAWSSVGGGMDGYVYSLAASGGELIAGGGFYKAGTVDAVRIAKWNGSSWSALGGGLSSFVYTILPVGSELYAGGSFTQADGASANYVARWNGTSWSALGSAAENGVGYTVRALAAREGRVYVGGEFETAGSKAIEHLACFDAAGWSALGSGNGMGPATRSPRIHAIADGGSGGVYVGGEFKTAGLVPANYVARWDGQNWSALGTGMDDWVYALRLNGTDLYAGGAFSKAGGVTVNGIAKWDGISWSALGGGTNGEVQALLLDGGNLYIGGTFTTAGGVTVNHIAKWDGTSWSALGSGTDAVVHSLAMIGSDLYAGGYFLNAGGVSANYIAKWNGSSWSALGSGVDSSVFALASIGTDLYVGGAFWKAGGTEANFIAKWNGSSWSALGTGMTGNVETLAVDGSTLYAGGGFIFSSGLWTNHIAKWDGTSWSEFGSGTDDSVYAIAGSGRQLYAGGKFRMAGNQVSYQIARWSRPEADMGVEALSCPSRGYAGSPLSYRFNVTNHGPDAASSATFACVLPKGMRLLSVELAQGSWELTSATVVCALGNLSVGQSASVAITVCPETDGRLVGGVAAFANEADLVDTNSWFRMVTDIEALRPGIDDTFTTNSEDATFQTGWGRFGQDIYGLARPGWSGSYQGAFYGQIWSDATRFRTAGYIANQTEWLPYSQVGSQNYVRAKYWVWAGGQKTTTNPLEIPNLRLRVQTRYAANSMLEVLHHDNGDPNGTKYATEFRPSADPNHPSLYRVDFDPVDVPYLVSNGDYEGIQRVFEVYATSPQDNGYIALGESVIGTYPASMLDDSLAYTTGTKIYAVTASDAGDLKIFNTLTDLSIKNIELKSGVGAYASTTSTLPLGSYQEGSFGVTLDTTQVPVSPVCGIVTREFFPGSDPAQAIRVEPGRQYKIRWHITSSQHSNQNAQLRLRARVVKFGWTQKYEIGGAWATGGATTLGANNAIAQQLLPGLGCMNPDRIGNESNGGWYTMLVHTPLSSDIRAEMPGVPLSVSMPKLSACPGPGSMSNANAYRDLKVACDLVDTLSGGANAWLEKGSFTIDRIEVRTYDLVDDGGY